MRGPSRRRPSLGSCGHWARCSRAEAEDVAAMGRPLRRSRRWLCPRRPPAKSACLEGPILFGLYLLFRQTKRKTEGPQHFAFPEISRENRGCLVLHSGNSRLSLSLRAGLGQNLRQNRGNRQHPGRFPGIPGFSRYTRKIPGILPIWLILGPNQPHSDSGTRLRARKI